MTIPVYKCTLLYILYKYMHICMHKYIRTHTNIYRPTLIVIHVNRLIKTSWRFRDWLMQMDWPSLVSNWVGHAAILDHDLENTFLSHLVHWIAYVIIFILTNVKRYPGIRTRTHRIVCIKRIPSVKKGTACWIVWRQMVEIWIFLIPVEIKAFLNAVEIDKRIV